MRKLLLLISLILPTLVGAIPMEIENATETASPFPNAKKGINILPLKEINIPAPMKNQILRNKGSLTANGYEDTTDTDENVLSLFKLQRNAKEEISKFDDSKNPYDTHLKSSVSKLDLAFNFQNIPGVQKKNIIGYAAVGGYVKGKGWDGVVEFISNPKFGICSYTTYKIEKAILDKETTEYLVNKKPSNKSVAGNWNVGFLYTVNWYIPDRLMSFECANKMFDPVIINDMIALANHIDKQRNK